MKYKLGEICESVSETYKGKDTYVILVNTSDVLNGQVLNHTASENKNLRGQFKKTFKKDDILFSEIRPANKRFAFINFEQTNNYIASTKLMVIRADTRKIRPLFLFHYLTSQYLLEELQHLAELRSGTFPQITFSTELANRVIDVPSFEEQDRIVGVISTIDQKIQTNQRINDNLSSYTFNESKSISPAINFGKRVSRKCANLTFSDSFAPIFIKSGVTKSLYCFTSLISNSQIGREPMFCG